LVKKYHILGKITLAELNKNAYNNMYAFFVDRFQQIKANKKQRLI